MCSWNKINLHDCRELWVGWGTYSKQVAVACSKRWYTSWDLKDVKEVASQNSGKVLQTSTIHPCWSPTIMPRNLPARERCTERLWRYALDFQGEARAHGAGVCMLSHCVQLFAALWIVAHQALLYMGFSRQEYWSGLQCPPLGDIPNPGMEP